MASCLRCSESRVDLIDTTEDGSGYCEACRLVFNPDPSRLPVDPPERVRRDIDG